MCKECKIPCKVCCPLNPDCELTGCTEDCNRSCTPTMVEVDTFVVENCPNGRTAETCLCCMDEK